MSAMSSADPPAKRARPAALEARVSTLALPSLGTICGVVEGMSRLMHQRAGHFFRRNEYMKTLFSRSIVSNRLASL